MALFGSPSARSSSTWISRGVSDSGAAGSFAVLRYGSTIASASTSSARAAASVGCSPTTSARPLSRILSRSRAAGDPTRITRMGDKSAVNSQRPTPNSLVDQLGRWKLEVGNCQLFCPPRGGGTPPGEGGYGGGRAAARDVEPQRASGGRVRQQIEQVLRRGDRLIVHLQHDTAHQEASGIGRAPRRDPHDEERRVAVVRPLLLGELHRLSGDSEVAAFHLALL